MGILDKVKEVAGTAVEAGKKAADVAKDKVEDVQVRRKADEAAKKLGYLVAEKGVVVGGDGDALVAEIKELEAQLAAQAQSEGASPAADDAGDAAGDAPA